MKTAAGAIRWAWPVLQRAYNLIDKMSSDDADIVGNDEDNIPVWAYVVFSITIVK